MSPTMFKPRRSGVSLLLIPLSCVLLLTFYTTHRRTTIHRTIKRTAHPQTRPRVLSPSSSSPSQHNPISNEEKPLLTLVLTTHNVKPVLQETLSTLQLPSSIHLHIIDDASTDGTTTSFKALNATIHALSSNTLGGVGTPSNLAIEALSTKYVAFLDGDDLLTPTTLTEMLNLAERTKADIVYADFTRFRDTPNGRVWLPAYDLHRWPPSALIHRSQRDTIGFGVQAFGMSPVPWRKLYNVDFLKNNGIAFPEGDYVFEDNAFHWLVTTHAGKVVYNNRSVVAHRLDREGQSTSTFRGNRRGVEGEEEEGEAIKARKAGAGMVHYIGNQNFVGFRLLQCRLNKWRCDSVRARFLDWVTGSQWVSKIVSKAGDDKITRKFQSVKRRTAAFWRRVMLNRHPYMREGAWKSRNLFVNRAPELSVVVPVFNDREFIDAFLENMSELKVRYEIVFVDNNSTDGSLAYLERVTRDMKHVFVLYTPRPGAGRARNLGLLFAEGRHVIFLDCDDRFDTEVLDKTVLHAQESGAEVTMLRYELEYVSKTNTGYVVKRRSGMFPEDTKLFNQALATKSLEQRRQAVAAITNYPWNKLMDREFLTRENIFFGGTKVNNDVLFHWHGIASARSIAMVDATVTTHRKFENGGRITDMKGEERVQLADALAMTNRVLVKIGAKEGLLECWERFVRKLLKWGRDRIGESWIVEFDRREAVVKRLVAGRDSALVMREL